MTDFWLNRWLPLIVARSNNNPVLELGCGEGADSVTLLAAGVSLNAIDICAESIAQAKKLVPAAQFHQQDIRDPWPVEPFSTSVVIASLSLHYFSWPETVDIVSRIHEVLRPGGILICRLNSTNDYNYGAIGHPEIAENYYSVNGEPKRFFDKPTVEKLFQANWYTIELAEKITNKYDMPKTLWEIVVKKEASMDNH
jgi:trans-aconitate methyltransferase